MCFCYNNFPHILIEWIYLIYPHKFTALGALHIILPACTSQKTVFPSFNIEMNFPIQKLILKIVFTESSRNVNNFHISILFLKNKKKQSQNTSNHKFVNDWGQHIRLLLFRIRQKKCLFNEVPYKWKTYTQVNMSLYNLKYTALT